MARPKGYKCSPETIAKQKATRAANKAAKDTQVQRDPDAAAERIANGEQA